LISIFMNMSSENPDSRWEKLLRLARFDAGPPADLAALLRVVRQAPVAERAGWFTDFVALFSSDRALAGCVAGAGAFALVAAWQIWDVWQAVPWAQLLDAATGGGS
jgi:hypothetical protein